MNRRTSLAFSPGAAGPLLADEEPWQERARCAEVGGDLWFPENGADPGEVRQAKAVCLSCPVRVPCLEDALARDERYGIWGGLSRRQRLRLTSRQAREALREAA